MFLSCVENHPHIKIIRTFRYFFCGSSHSYYVTNECCCVPIKHFYGQLKFEFHIIFTYHKILSLFWPFKNINSLFSWQAIQKQVMSWTWAMFAKPLTGGSSYQPPTPINNQNKKIKLTCTLLMPRLKTSNCKYSIQLKTTQTTVWAYSTLLLHSLKPSITFFLRNCTSSFIPKQNCCSYYTILKII